MRWAGRPGCQGAHPFKGPTSTADPDGQTEAQRQGAVCPRSRPSTPAARESPSRAVGGPGAGGRPHPRPPATHVVLAGDEALLEAQEGDVADEGVPHGELRAALAGAPPGWALNALERGSGPCRAGLGQEARRAQKGFLLLSLSGSPQAPTAGARTAARTPVCEDQLVLVLVLPVPARPRRWGFPHHASPPRPPMASAAPRHSRLPPPRAFAPPGPSPTDL